MSEHVADRVAVPLSRMRLLLMLAGALAFVALGWWMIPNAGSARSSVRYWELVMISAATIGFFGWVGVALAVKLFDPRPGLVIDREGIFDNSSGVSAGHVPWSEIKRFHVTGVKRERFLTIVVADPEKYIRRASLLKRPWMRMNAKQFGGAIQIGANALRMDFEEMLDAVERAAPSRLAGDIRRGRKRLDD
jgi:hypothetical protein